jgi:poly(3-hydroxybutyrate) depolymerase
MIYEMYQSQADAMEPMRMMAGLCSEFLRGIVPDNPYGMNFRQLTASLDLFGHLGVTHRRPDYAIRGVMVGNRIVDVEAETMFETPFAGLVHFRKNIDRVQPPVLLVAPMSGHFSTLLRNTAKTLLREHDVYITDWHNARDVQLRQGHFGFDEYIEHVLKFLEFLGERSHVLAVCQPATAVLAAVAIMSEDRNPLTPRSMTLMGGPIDTRYNPTDVNRLAKTRDISWFEEHMIGVVPWRFAGAGRRVYPGFIQLSAFVAMNINKHVGAHFRQFRSLMEDDQAAANMHRAFYDEYLAVMDLPAEFYLETVKKIFMDHDLPLGKLKYHGRLVKPEAISKTFLLTVEGKRDDVCGLGQTAAALELCAKLPDALKRRHVQADAGHYGIFSGRRWEAEIYPLVRDVIQCSA